MPRMPTIPMVERLPFLVIRAKTWDAALTDKILKDVELIREEFLAWYQGR